MQDGSHRSGGDLRFAVLSVAESHSCGVTTGGTGYCWGERALGSPQGTPCEKGQDVNACVAPVAVSGGLAFSSIQVGRDHTCGITTGKIIYCWGAILGAPYSDVPVKVIGQA